MLTVLWWTWHASQKTSKIRRCYEGNATERTVSICYWRTILMNQCWTNKGGASTDNSPKRRASKVCCTVPVKVHHNWRSEKEIIDWEISRFWPGPWFAGGLELEGYSALLTQIGLSSCSLWAVQSGSMSRAWSLSDLPLSVCLLLNFRATSRVFPCRCICIVVVDTLPILLGKTNTSKAELSNAKVENTDIAGMNVWHCVYIWLYWWCDDRRARKQAT